MYTICFYSKSWLMLQQNCAIGSKNVMSIYCINILKTLGKCDLIATKQTTSIGYFSLVFGLTDIWRKCMGVISGYSIGNQRWKELIGVQQQILKTEAWLQDTMFIVAVVLTFLMSLLYAFFHHVHLFCPALDLDHANKMQQISKQEDGTLDEEGSNSEENVSMVKVCIDN